MYRIVCLTFKESISTCRFAGRVALIKNKVTRNEAVDPSVIIERLKRENQQLRAEIKLLRGEGISYLQSWTDTKDNLEPYEIDECKKKVDDFLESQDPSATLILSNYINHSYSRWSTQVEWMLLSLQTFVQGSTKEGTKRNETSTITTITEWVEWWRHQAVEVAGIVTR